ncbi:DUF5710 domain-containing protein [Pseudonocardia broussonetiae]
MRTSFYLDAPFAEKDEAKALGARATASPRSLVIPTPRSACGC